MVNILSFVFLETSVLKITQSVNYNPMWLYFATCCKG